MLFVCFATFYREMIEWSSHDASELIIPSDLGQSVNVFFVYGFYGVSSSTAVVLVRAVFLRIGFQAQVIAMYTHPLDQKLSKTIQGSFCFALADICIVWELLDYYCFVIADWVWEWSQFEGTAVWCWTEVSDMLILFFFVIHIIGHATNSDTFL